MLVRLAINDTSFNVNLVVGLAPVLAPIDGAESAIS